MRTDYILCDPWPLVFCFLPKISFTVSKIVEDAYCQI
jgi:hypothetical protein